MNMYVTVFLRIMLFVSLAILVFSDLKVEQLFIQMERGYIDGFSVDIVMWPGYLAIATTLLFLIANIIQIVLVGKKKSPLRQAFISLEYDVSDERAVENTRKAVSWAFSILLLYSFLVLGSYMLIPNYFLDHIWYPLFTTASIPIVGLLVYLTTYKILQFK